MNQTATKHRAEALLRELPSVVAANVREDVYGHPREVHILLGPGPDVRFFARDVRELLEERLGIPVDQRVISIAQLAAEASAEAVPALRALEREAATHWAGPPSEERPELAEPRAVLRGVDTESNAHLVRVGVRLIWAGRTFSSEAEAVDAGEGRSRAGARAALLALTATCENLLHLELEGVSTVPAFGREYVLVEAMAAATWLGREPLTLFGAHPVGAAVETAAALAALKATNRIAARALRR